jgi:CHAT domain-containing protein/tetratricopeptide (TPR) repeat protein
VSPNDTTVELSESLLDELAGISDETARSQFLAEQQLYCSAAARQLNDASRTKLRVDPRQSLALAEAAIVVARSLNSDEMLGPGLRAKANALYVLGDNQAALDFHAHALAIFQRQGNREEEARTLNASIQPFILLGDYDRALESAKAAGDIFKILGDRRRLAHVEINVGNLYHRQDRFEEALAYYGRAYQTFLTFSDSEGIGIALYNSSVCLISTNNFPRALASYQQARETFVARGMTLLVGQADYNIAYLYYLRGEYGRAIAMLRAAREQSETNGDAHILALCYLDLSDIYLELNLSSQAAEVAHEGVQRFKKLGMGYEEAKCLTNEAIAWSQQGKRLRAIDLFADARSVFVREKNQVWPWLVDLYRALALFDEGRLFEARKSCKSALGFFETSTSPEKAVICHLLLSRIELQAGNCPSALEHCKNAMARLSKLDMPILDYQAHYVVGQVHAEAGNLREAYFAYQKARERLETVRSKLRKEELKIAFIKDKSEVYARLIEICLNQADESSALAEAFQYVELTKYRSPAEMILEEIHEAPENLRGNSDMVRRLRALREELNWYYHRIELAQLSSDQNDAAKIEQLHAEARAREQAMIEVLQDGPSFGAEARVQQPSAISSLEAIRASLTPEVSLIEYFAISGQLFAVVLTNTRLEIFPVTLLSTVAGLVQKLRAHFFRVSLDNAQAKCIEISQVQIAQDHLRGLYAELFEPLVRHVSGQHIVFVPHGFLHSLPFHALFDGERYLIDRFTVSCAPSATIYARCRARGVRIAGSSLVLGLGIEEEAIQKELAAVASAMKSAVVLSGGNSPEGKWAEVAATARWIHIAGQRRDPKHEGLSLAAGPASLHLSPSYIFQLQLQPELISLSGFAPGLDSDPASTSTDSLALARCFLESGTASVLSTLWDLPHFSPAEFLRIFYEQQDQDNNKAKAFQMTLHKIRECTTHPVFWSLFSLSGAVLPQ